VVYRTTRGGKEKVLKQFYNPFQMKLNLRLIAEDSRPYMQVENADPSERIVEIANNEAVAVRYLIRNSNYTELREHKFPLNQNQLSKIRAKLVEFEAQHYLEQERDVSNNHQLQINVVLDFSTGEFKWVDPL